jgi:lysophospholipase L1-like esterase
MSPSRRLLLALILLLPGIPTRADTPGIFIAGDSTASNGAENGWGSQLQKFFDPGQLTVMNRARGGRSSRTFITEGLWDGIVADLKAGDTVLIQFGHNDAGPINDSSRARGSIPGLGEETEEIDNQVTGEHEIVHTYGWYLRKMIQETRDKGAKPVILSLTARDVWINGNVERSGVFSNLARQVAEQAGLDFIPLRERIADQYEILGPVRVRELFPFDHTHTDPDGAYLNAAMVVSGLKALESCPVTQFLNAEGQRVTPYAPHVIVKQMEEWMTAPWMPDVQPVSDPNLPTLYVIGDSTVRNGRLGNGSNGQWGWGAPIADYFDRSRINVENHAMGGTSTRTYRSLGLWDEVLQKIKPGDYVIMQFGHNDSSPINDDSRARGTIRSNGNEVEEIDNLLTGEHEIVHSYGWYLRQFIAETRSRGATALVCSPIPRNNFNKEGRLPRAGNDWGLWAMQAAREAGGRFIDLNERIADIFEELGAERVGSLYYASADNTHTSAAGAMFNARRVMEGIKDLANCDLADYLKVVTPH